LAQGREGFPGRQISVFGPHCHVAAASESNSIEEPPHLKVSDIDHFFSLPSVVIFVP
jgi:hypothetical protein